MFNPQGPDFSALTYLVIADSKKNKAIFLTEELTKNFLVQLPASNFSEANSYRCFRVAACDIQSKMQVLWK